MGNTSGIYVGAFTKEIKFTIIKTTPSYLGDLANQLYLQLTVIKDGRKINIELKPVLEKSGILPTNKIYSYFTYSVKFTETKKDSNGEIVNVPVSYYVEYMSLWRCNEAFLSDGITFSFLIDGEAKRTVTGSFNRIPEIDCSAFV